VGRGEVLSSIARAHDTSIADVVKRNPGLDADALREGQELTLCAGSARPAPKRSCGRGRKVFEHRVRRGENLGAIAKRYAVKEAALLKRNDGQLHGDRTALQAGQRLEVCTQPARAHAAKVCGYRTPLHQHVIVPGEWLAEVASRYGVPQKDLLRLNPRLRKNPDYLRPGRKLRVCPDIPPRTRERIDHRVASGQTIASIAERYDLHPQQLLRFQQGRLDDPDRLRVGQKLIVWKDGGIVEGFGSDDEKGSLDNGLQLPEGAHYRIKNRNTAWGTPRTLRLIQSATARYRRGARGPAKVLIGDLSRRGGGPFPPHKSHQTGQDVDVGYALRDDDGSGRRFRRATAKNLDAARTWKLVDAFLATGAVRYIFMDYRIQEQLYEHARSAGVSRSRLDELFQYPRGKRRAYGIIRDDPGHDDHFHVRFQ
jgi:LysM repeat protein